MQFSIAFVTTALAIFLQTDSGSASPTDLAKKVEYVCPQRARVGNFGPYAQHTYADEEAKAAMKAAAEIQQKKGENWKPGHGEYPHFFNNRENLPFKCGKNKSEFPIEMNNRIWQLGNSVSNIPDREIGRAHV